MSNDSQPPVFLPDSSKRHAAHSHRQPRARSWLRTLGEFAIILVLALLVSALLRQFVLQIYSIPSESMVNTLNKGDRILVNRIPVVGKQFERGDVVVFRDELGWMAPADEPKTAAVRAVGEFLGIVPTDGKQVLVKRVIGVGGDTVACAGDGAKVTVNGKAVDETYLPAGVAPSNTAFSVVVPQGKLWLLGDNRPHSGDSLYHLGQGTEFVDRGAVIGRVEWVVWPLSHWASVSHREVFADVPQSS